MLARKNLYQPNLLLGTQNNKFSIVGPPTPNNDHPIPKANPQPQNNN